MDLLQAFNQSDSEMISLAENENDLATIFEEEMLVTETPLPCQPDYTNLKHQCKYCKTCFCICP